MRCAGPDLNPRRPRSSIPAGAVDCHCHVFEDPALYPLAKNRSYTPALAPLSEYLRMIDTLGIERTVQVNASVYGFDNSPSLAVIERLGTKRALGIAGVSPDVSAQELKRLHRGGMRGVRLSTMLKGYGGPDALAAIAPKIKPLGWHVQLHVDNVAELAALESELLAYPTPLVFDHLGRVRGSQGVNTPGFQALLRLLKQRDDCWVKLSSWYRLSDSGPPGYDDIRPLAETLIATRPDRMVWGSNWPHPIWNGVMPNDGDLLDNLCAWAGDAPTIEKILVANPIQLYGFD